MANVLVEEKTMTDIANAIRTKSGTDKKMKPAEMPKTIREIASGNPYQILQDKFFYSGRSSFVYAFSYTKITYDDLSNLVLDTSKGMNFGSMFSYCNNLTTIPQLDTSKGMYFISMFSSCNNLTTIPQLDTSKGMNFDNMFSYCNNLTTIPQLDTSKGINFTRMFFSCVSLENIVFVANSIKKSISFSDSNKLTVESIHSIINGLADLTGQTAQTITFHSDVKTKLTEEQIASATSKNWNIA